MEDVHVSYHQFIQYVKHYTDSLKKYSFWFLCIFLFAFLLWPFKDNISLYLFFTDLKAIPWYQWLIYIVLGLLAVSATTIYDFILCRELNLKINPKKIFTISWIGDLPILFAQEHEKRKGELRYSLYKYEGVSTKKARLISILKDIFLTVTSDELPESFKLPFTTRLQLILGFFIKWLSAFGLFLLFYITYTPQANKLHILLVFAIAMIVANLSPLPAGIFIFDLICLLGFNRYGMDLQNSFLAIGLFRMSYYLIPWLLTLVGLTQLSRKEKKKTLNENQVHFIQKVSVRALACLIFFGGLALVFSASFTYYLHLSPNVANSFKLLSLFIGIYLIILSKGIWDRVITSYYATLILLGLGILSAIFVTSDLGTALILAVIAWALQPMKSAFHRHPAPFCWRIWLLSFAIVLCSLVIYLFTMHLIFDDFIIMLPQGLIFYSQLLFVLLLTGMGATLLMLLSAMPMYFEPLSEEQLIEFKSFLANYEGHSMTHLIFLKDKQLFYTCNKQVVIAYRAYKDKLIVLGDPIGNVDCFKEAINDFRVFADYHRMTPIFYEVNEAYLPMYHENGLTFLKLGEEATMTLSDYTLVGKKYAQLRTIKNKMLRGEFTFELLQPPFDPQLIHQLKTISDAWLDGRREKTFSLGFFDENYISLTPLALIKQDDTLIGFATIMPMYSTSSISIDLMRLIPHPPNGAMDALFIGIIEWAIEEGYAYFVLGKAPLSNVGYNEFSPTKEKLVKLFYRYGNKIYSFKGLRRYKEKYHPSWKGIYLAYPKHTNLSLTLIQLTKMISGSE